MKAASFHYVAKLNVGPYLTLSANTYIVIDVQSSHRIENAVASDPAIPSDLDGPFTMNERKSMKFAVVAQAKFRHQDSRLAPDVTKVTQHNSTGRSCLTTDQDTSFYHHTSTDAKFLSLDGSFDFC